MLLKVELSIRKIGINFVIANLFVNRSMLFMKMII